MWVPCVLMVNLVYLSFRYCQSTGGEVLNDAVTVSSESSIWHAAAALTLSMAVSRAYTSAPSRPAATSAIAVTMMSRIESGARRLDRPAVSRTCGWRGGPVGRCAGGPGDGALPEIPANVMFCVTVSPS